MTRHLRHAVPVLELRVVVNDTLTIGPVQATLLENIREMGSMSAAARRLGISYAHAWKLVAAMNAAFVPPVVEPVRGGSKGGGAILTRQGQNVLDSFRRLERLSRSQGSAELLIIGRATGHFARTPAGS
jgi:molybdate transport system regulatory protein